MLVFAKHEMTSYSLLSPVPTKNTDTGIEKKKKTERKSKPKKS